MDILKKVAAVIVGILVLVLVILLARTVGEKIRERYFVPKTVVTSNLPMESLPLEPEPIVEKTQTATYSAIPKTGPVEVFYLFSSLAAVSGIVLRKVSS